MEKVSNDLEIKMYLHCGKCLGELPVGMSPQDYAQIETGWTPKGIQIWCKRHDCNIINIDFEGQKHPANTTRKEK